MPAAAADTDDIDAALPASLVAAVAHFTTTMRHIEWRIERPLDGRPLDDAETQARTSAACSGLAAAFRDHVRGAPHLEPAIGRYVAREASGFLMRSASFDRWLTKPRGYAGDYYTIELLYDDRPAGDGRLGHFIDRWALDLAAVQAVRNRRGLLARAIRDVADDVADAGEGTPVRVTSLASGPAREVLDVLAAPDAPPLRATCIDIDAEAVAYAAERARELGVADRVVFAQDNVLRLSRGRGRTTLAPQHMIYSVGLIDYLAGDHIVRLLDWAHDQLVPGGTVVLGNFDVENPDRMLMDHVMEWRLIHRTADDLRALFARSRFGDAAVDVRAEAQGINLFAFCTRPSGGGVRRAA